MEVATKDQMRFCKDPSNLSSLLKTCINKGWKQIKFVPPPQAKTH